MDGEAIIIVSQTRLDLSEKRKKHVNIAIHARYYLPMKPTQILPCEQRLQFFGGLKEFSGLYFKIPDIPSGPLVV